MSLIYIVEDDKNIQEIEMFSLKNSGYIVCGFENAKDFYKRIAEKQPDLVILDIMLPDEDGLSILKKLRSTPDTRRIPVIMVTAKTTEIDTVKGLELGADDYISKPFVVMELVSRVKALLRRTGESKEDKVIRLGKIYMDDERHTVYVDDRVCELTFKEYELLSLLMNNRNRVMSRDVIMDRIWSTDYEGESRTLDVHIKTLRQKLGEEGARIKTIRNVGYVME